ncbi:MAG: BadF/BadG/BcrA/BcrD ATPase family protein [Acidobacteriota bacterium]
MMQRSPSIPTGTWGEIHDECELFFMYVLGIDAGASKTDCLLADETGTILSRSRGPGANLQIFGEETVASVLARVIDKALSERAATADALCVGMAGADRPRDSEAVQDILDRIGRSQRNMVTNDAVVALVAPIQS